MTRFATFYQPLSHSYTVRVADGSDREIGSFRFTTNSVEFFFAPAVTDEKRARQILMTEARAKKEELLAYMDAPVCAFIG